MNASLLLGKMVEKGYNIKTLAEKIGITPSTLSRKLKNGKFYTEEVVKICAILDIKNPLPFFFDFKVQPVV